MFNFKLMNQDKVTHHDRVAPRRAHQRATMSMVLVLGAVALLAAACSSSKPAVTKKKAKAPVTTTTSTTTTTTTTTTSTLPPPSQPALPIKTRTVTIHGVSETVLTDAQGYTLYYFDPDTPTHSACTTNVLPNGKVCNKFWPPLVAPSGVKPTAQTHIPGKPTILKDPNGNQVEYNGYLLYAFSQDHAPGEASGEGFGGKWWVVTPGITPRTTTSTTSSSTTTSSSSGY